MSRKIETLENLAAEVCCISKRKYEEQNTLYEFLDKYQDEYEEYIKEPKNQEGLVSLEKEYKEIKDNLSYLNIVWPTFDELAILLSGSKNDPYGWQEHRTDFSYDYYVSLC